MVWMMRKLLQVWPALVWLVWQISAPGLLGEDATPRLTLPTGPTLAFGSVTNEYDAKPEDTSAPFLIYVTNAWSNAIVIESVHTSCHCTVATMPASPWVLQPGEEGVIHASVELEGQDGLVSKELTFFTSVGERVVTLIVSIPPAPHPGDAVQTEAERQAAVRLATTDAREIFKGECATCHADKARGLLGGDLYAAACGICHDAPRRARVVPDLRTLKQPVDLDYWRQIISHGKTNSMMPGFARAEGGPLSDLQVSSLAAWLDKTISPHPPPR
jgi:mono/diheme cytochrome c family protein